MILVMMSNTDQAAVTGILSYNYILTAVWPNTEKKKKKLQITGQSSSTQKDEKESLYLFRNNQNCILLFYSIWQIKQEVNVHKVWNFLVLWKCYQHVILRNQCFYSTQMNCERTVVFCLAEFWHKTKSSRSCVWKSLKIALVLRDSYIWKP